MATNSAAVIAAATSDRRDVLAASRSGLLVGRLQRDTQGIPLTPPVGPISTGSSMTSQVLCTGTEAALLLSPPGLDFLCSAAQPGHIALPSMGRSPPLSPAYAAPRSVMSSPVGQNSGFTDAALTPIVLPTTLPPSLSPHVATLATASEGETCIARCMAVEVDSIARIVPVHDAVCGICNASMSSLPAVEGGAESVASMDHGFIDGRLVCEMCRLFLEPAEFVPTYHVCINPLCRRKWKQLTPKILPHFCPPCKRQLEEGIAGRHHFLAATLIEQMYNRWYQIWAELVETFGNSLTSAPHCVLGVEQSRNGGSERKFQKDNAGSRTSTLKDECSDSKSQMHWRDILVAFRDSFPPAPRAEDVRNWNSVHGRRKHYRGVIHRCHRRFVCTVEALQEVEEDLQTARRTPQGVREFTLLDWHQQLFEGQEVHFVAFPNPSVAERNTVSRIVRLLNTADGLSVPAEALDGSASADERAHPGSPLGRFSSASASCKAVNARFCRIKEDLPSTKNTMGADLSLATSCSAFEDLVQWSNEMDAEPAAVLRAANTGMADISSGYNTRMHLSLETALQLNPESNYFLEANPLRHAQSGQGKGPRNSPQGVIAKPSQQGTPNSTHQPWASQLTTVAGCRPQGALRSPPFRSPFMGKGRSPMICPRSPFAAYFDD